MADDAKAKAAEMKALGTAAYKAKDFETALKHYNGAAEADPTDMVFHLNIGAVYLEMKDFDKSIAACTKAREVAMDNRADFKLQAKACARIAKAHNLAGNKDTAVEFYDKALSNHRFKDYLVAKKKIQAESKEEKRLAYIDPTEAAAAKARGNEFFKTAKYPEAIKEYSEALDRNPDDAAFTSRIYSNRSACYTKLAAFDVALKDAKECIVADPAFIKGYLRKANCLIMMKKEEEAINTYQEALKIDPNNGEAKEGVQKAYQAKYGNEANMSREEKAAKAMKNPEIQAIIQDPIMQQILQQMQQDPSSAQAHMKDPVISAKIMKLAESGILEMR